MKNLFIPKRLKIGFQERPGTFTGKLAYVIYYDEKNNLRKEKSWNSWCDSNIPSIEIDNDPKTGFIFNKGIQRSSEWFGSGRSVFRVYSPDDFEFEINSDNLINLLMHSDISKREILESCVFAWCGTELILLPVNSVEYQDAIEYTEKQDQVINTKELVKGHTYKAKKQDVDAIYIGYFPYYEWSYNWKTNNVAYSSTAKGKKHIFVGNDKFVYLTGKNLSYVVNAEVVDNYADLVDAWHSSENSSAVIDIGLDHEYNPPQIMPTDYGKWVYWWNIENDILTCHGLFVRSDLSNIDTSHVYTVNYMIDKNDGLKLTRVQTDGSLGYRYSTPSWLKYEYDKNVHNIFDYMKERGWSLGVSFIFEDGKRIDGKTSL
jgi:hypothetical protein